MPRQRLATDSPDGSADGDGEGGPPCGANWAELPEEIVATIVDATRQWPHRIRRSTLETARFACSAWSANIAACSRDLKVSGAAAWPSRELNRLDCWKGLTNLCLHAVPVTDVDLQIHVASLGQLAVLRLRNCRNFSDRGIEWLLRLTSLRELSLSFCSQVDGRTVDKLPRLTSLSLEGCGVPKDLRAVARLSSLTRLDLSFCSQVEDSSLLSLEKLTLLQELRLGWCRSLSTRDLCVLSSLPALRCLHIEGVEMEPLENLSCLLALRQLSVAESFLSARSYSEISHLSALATLDLSWCETATDHSVLKLCRLCNLRRLNLAWCTQVSDISVQHMTTLTRLEYLNLENTQVSDLGLLALTQLTQLTDLGLRRLYRLTDNSRTALTRFTALTRLNLGGCSRLTERTLIDVSPVLTRLTDLNLRGCDAVTDDGLASISSCSSLIRLDLKECDAVTEIGFHRFFRSSYVVPFLKALSLTRCASINDSCLLTMASHADALEELNLSGCRRITDVGVSALEDISSLHRVELKHCRKVSAEVIDGLKLCHVMASSDIEASDGSSSSSGDVHSWGGSMTSDDESQEFSDGYNTVESQ